MIGTGQHAGVNRGGRDGPEQGRFTTVRFSDQRNTYPLFASEKLIANGDGYLYGGLLHALIIPSLPHRDKRQAN